MNSLRKLQNPIIFNGTVHIKIYIVMILPETSCCRPFHSFCTLKVSHTVARNHSIFNMQKFEKWNIMSIHRKPLCKI